MDRKEYMKAYSKQYAQDNKAKLRTYLQEWRRANQDKEHARFKRYYQRHRDTELARNSSPSNKHRRRLQYRDFNVKMVMLYTSIKNRVTRSPFYKNRELTFSKEEFLQWIQLNLTTYTKLYQAWKDSNFKVRYSPSVDRINNAKGYSLDNIQLIFQYENARKNNRPGNS